VCVFQSLEQPLKNLCKDVVKYKLKKNPNNPKGGRKGGTKQ
jgi:hypothetical protein